ncbi:tRNA (adenosine(37)-N6)-dimethylallyltransferase MiaA [Limnobacter sp.]|uniref:tRNA (adenosine(37)-N6)-dimethylallyltransferase MiaA n=1 Tax=Limnobacter sp. TaxID=2003368 RepID=UPI00258565E7|nr:tRNA (adenosine(37)-N6)-dimethylallyltransferase MiaA [Limnobacter sp.]HEX5485892.1 tRNA (adenosine(37)-N6)-dimethylallyltransferase MiaA [Limnobacter sp.]
MVSQRAVNQLGNSIPALAIVGPTASGKSALGLWLAHEGLPVEIISLDSALVFQDMNIGTAKPTPEELAQVPHHLIDIITPEQSFSAADFLNENERLISEIRGRGKVPVIVGGTMMYYRAMLSGMDDLPQADPQVRADIDAFAKQKGWPAVHDELAKVDPETAARLFPNDSQRLQRALEVYRLTGLPLSSFHKRGEEGQQRQLPTLSLEPADRSVLHDRIEQRFRSMLDQGLVQEVVGLLEKYTLNANMPSLRCVGYRQVHQYLQGQCTYDQMIAQGIAATRQLAKRQITWLRSTPHKHVVDPLQSGWMEQVKPWLIAQVSELAAGIPRAG